MILNLFIREPRVGVPCKNCGTLIVEVKLETGFHTFLDALPDPLGTMHIAFYRGDNMEHLAHPPPVPRDNTQLALSVWRVTGERPLFSIHRCPPSGYTGQAQASPQHGR